MTELYLQVVFIMILIGVLSTLYTYSKEGDISTYTSGCPNLKTMKNSYPTKESVAERLHSLLIYKESYVKWNKFIIIAMFASLVILYALRSSGFKVSEFIVLTCFIFLCIDLPNRWAYAHISKGIIQEATQLYTHHHSIEK